MKRKEIGLRDKTVDDIIQDFGNVTSACTNAMAIILGGLIKSVGEENTMAILEVALEQAKELAQEELSEVKKELARRSKKTL